MTDTPWLRGLAQVNREKEAEERSRLDERWDRLSAGELTPEEEAELIALAGSSEEAHEAYEAFRPLGPDFQASVVRAIQAREPKARVLPFRRTALRYGGWLSTAAAAAAVLVLLLRPPAPLPDYGTPQVSGVQAMRGEQPENAEIPSLAPGRFEVVLQPSTSVSRLPSLEARCFLVQGKDLRRLEIRKQEHDPGGSIRIVGMLGSDIPPGRWTLWAVIGRPGKLPEDAELRSLSGKAPLRRPDWVVLPKEVLIQPEGLSP